MNLEMDFHESSLSLLEVKRQLQSEFAGRIANLQLLIDSGGVVLRGYAKSQHAKQVLQSAILERLRIKIQANEIAVTKDFKENDGDGSRTPCKLLSRW